MRVLGMRWIPRFRRRRTESMPCEEVRANGKRKMNGFEELVMYMSCMGLFTQNIPMLIRPFDDGDSRRRNRYK